MLYRFRWKLGWSRHVRVGDEACPHCGELVAARSRVRRRLGAVLVVHRSDVDRAHGREATEPGNVVIDLRGGLDAGRRRRWTRASTRTSIATSIAIGCACLTALRRRALVWCERARWLKARQLARCTVEAFAWNAACYRAGDDSILGGARARWLR
jgi:hypothetical protein